MTQPGRPLRVLFICTANSARSQIAATILNQKGAGRFVAESAGSHPAGEVNPGAIAALERYGYRWPGGHPRGLDEVMADEWDFVVTVCDRARETCPILPGQPMTAHWGLPDPAAVEGPDEERRRAFDDTVLAMTRRVDLFLALLIGKLTRLALEQRVRSIGGASEGTIR